VGGSKGRSFCKVFFLLSFEALFFHAIDYNCRDFISSKKVFLFLFFTDTSLYYRDNNIYNPRLVNSRYAFLLALYVKQKKKGFCY